MPEPRDHWLRRLRRELEGFDVSGGWQSPPTFELGKWDFGFPTFDVPSSMPVDRLDFRRMLDELENHGPGKES